MTVHTPIPGRPPAPAPAPIPVVCDRCRAEGLSNEDPFARFGALLDFDPVPRRTARADGWTEDVQRAFIAALSLTGSPRAACRAVGKAAYGAEQLRHVPGNEGFLAAWDEALEIAAGERGRRLAEGLAQVAAEQSAARRAAPPWSGAADRRGALPPPPADTRTDEQRADDILELIKGLIHKYTLKLESERRARLEGRIAAADFYVRQLTFIEICLEAVSGDPLKYLKEARIGNHRLTEVASTLLVTALDDARRAHWAAIGEPERPEHPPGHLTEAHDGYVTEPGDEYWFSDRGVSFEDYQSARKDQYARDARAQVEWENKARAQAAEWRKRQKEDPFGLKAGQAEDPPA